MLIPFPTMRIFSNPESDWFCPLHVRTLSDRKYKSLTYLDNCHIVMSLVTYSAEVSATI